MIPKEILKKKISEFRKKEKSYLSILKIIDSDREKLVTDIVKQCNDLQKQTKTRLDDLNTKFTTRLLRREVSQMKNQLMSCSPPLLTPNPNFNLDVNTVETTINSNIPMVNENVHPPASKSKKKKKKKNRRIKNVKEGRPLQTNTYSLVG